MIQKHLFNSVLIFLVILISFGIGCNMDNENDVEKQSIDTLYSENGNSGLGDLGIPKDYDKSVKHFDTTAAKSGSRSYIDLPWAYPDAFNWSTYGVVTPAKDQGSCGSCWAFATTGVMESKILILHNEQFDSNNPEHNLSEQQQVSCNHLPGTLGCDGAYMNNAMQFWLADGPLTELCAAYIGSNGSCNDYSQCEAVRYLIGDYYTLKREYDYSDGDLLDVNEVKASLYADGPGYFRFHVYVDFYNYWYQNNPDYTGGDWTGNDVYIKRLDSGLSGGHAVLIIGWDDNREIIDPSTQQVVSHGAYLCKNSWGTTAGPNGDGTFWIAYQDHDAEGAYAFYGIGFGMANAEIHRERRWNGDFIINNDKSMSMLSGYTSVSGNLTISGLTQPNLHELAYLTKIGGNLNIINNPGIISLEGLNSMVKIGGTVTISNNPSLNSISSLSYIRDMSTSFTITDNSSLDFCQIQSLQVFLSYIFYDGDYLISGNKSETCIPDTPSVCEGNYEIYDNYGLIAFYENGCTEITGDLIIEQSSATGLMGLINLTNIGGNLSIYSNSSLPDLDGMENLVEIGGNLRLEGNPELKNVNGLSNIRTVQGDLILYANTALTDISGLNNVTEIGGNLGMAGSHSLPSLNGFSGLTTINGYIIIWSNNKLMDLKGFGNITTVDGDIMILQNYKLPTCHVDQFLLQLQDWNGTGNISENNDEGICAVEGDFEISDIDDISTIMGCTSISGSLSIHSTSLINLDGLQSLTSIGGDLTFHDNTALTDISGLNNVTEIGGILGMAGSHSLSSLNGFYGLTTIGGDVLVWSNQTLKDLNGLGSVTTVNGNITILQNYQLPTCYADSFVAQLDNWNGTLLIMSNNDTGTCE